jgi:hypothetical protein
MLTQLYLGVHQLECDKTWTLVTLAFSQVDDIVGLPVEYTVVTKLHKRKATVHSVMAVAKTLVSTFVWC